MLLFHFSIARYHNCSQNDQGLFFRNVFEFISTFLTDLRERKHLLGIVKKYGKYSWHISKPSILFTILLYFIILPFFKFPILEGDIKGDIIILKLPGVI